jgi:hypothetical protein
MQSSAQQLIFEGVFINDPRCRTFYDVGESSPGGLVGDYERWADQKQTPEAEPKVAHEQANGERRLLGEEQS